MTAAQCVSLGLLVLVIVMYYAEHLLTKSHRESINRRRELRKWKEGKRDE